MKLFRVLALIVALSSVADPQSIRLPAAGRFVLPVSLGKELLRQCSRPTPSAVAGFWRPSSEDVDELEIALGKYLVQRDNAGKPIPPKNRAYHRQYVGFIKQGASGQQKERFIYANFYPESVSSELRSFDESAHVVGICDGGPAFWGIVYRVSTKTFEDIAFNGLA